MAISDSIQALSAAFSFGILLQAETGALLIYSRGHGSNIFKDGRRLVLVLFLLFSVLRAQIDFLELLIPTTATGICQAGLIFTTAFDQLARVALEQFLLWSVGHGTKITPIRAILQGLLAIRLIVGGVLVGVTRPQFAPTCVANTSILPVAIVVLVMDLIVVGDLLVQASSLGMFGDRREDRKAQSRALLFVIAGFAVWTATSIPMILGIPSILLIVRTVVPANGLLMLVGIVTFFSVTLMSPKQEDSVTAGARSPFSTSPMAPSRGMFQNGTGDEGSPIVSRPGTESQLSVVNPSSTPTQRDMRGFTKLADDGDSGAAQNASGYQAPGGVFPTIFAVSSLSSGQAALISANRRSLNAPASTKRPKVSVRGLAISKPIINEKTDPDTPFARIATIDLKTAVNNDRERRAMASKKSPFNAPRAAPLRPRMSPEDMLNATNNSTRKVVPDQSKELMLVSGLSTSALLSPARDEVRRRSPREFNNLEPLEEKQTFRPITGLPMNPRSQRSMMPRQNAAPQPQTVMLINDIVYDNPQIVQSIISRTPGHSKQKSLQELSPLAPYTSGFQPRESVMHRARPIPRHKNSGMFGREPLPVHRRTKSSSSILNRTSFFNTPGSPSQLPPLPQPPSVYTAVKLKKLLPNDTKSMTFDEKMEFLFPAPPGVNLINNRRSSVPDLPSMVGKLATSIEPDLQSNPISKRTTTIALLSPEGYPVKNISTEADSNRKTHRSNAVESVSETLVPSHNSTDTNIRKLRSARLSSDSLNENVQAPTPLEENYTNQISPSNAADTYRDSSYSTFSPLRSQRFSPDIERLEKMSEAPLEEDEGEGDEVMVVMMDSAEHRKSLAADRESFIFDINGLPVEATHSLPTWHRRIGDELPTFSERRSRHGSRKMSPPTALLLEPPRGRASPILIRNTEPTPPLDSPGRALQEIQDQLGRIEEPRRLSLGSLLRGMPATEGHGGFDDDDAMERLRLLENLEKEMGEQENDWQQMHQNFGRDSMSSIGTLATPQFKVSPESTRSIMNTAASQRLSLGLCHTSSRIARQRIRDSLAETCEEDEIISSEIQESSGLGDWQQRLANAHTSYREDAPTASHSRNSSINFLSVSKAPKAPLGSPTPPDSEPEAVSESEYESEEEFMQNEMPIPSPYHPNKLWQPVVPSAKAAASLLWSTITEKPSLQSEQSPEPPAKHLRPIQRRSEVVMQLSSDNLWSKSSPSVQPTSSVLVQKLWGSTSVQASTIKARPVTQRPPRRSKRITLLADIIENPEPLPSKRDTLGIFQFPWGERSDTAIPQPTYNPLYQAGPVLNAALDSRSRQLEPELSEYSSSSFFEDDDEEDELLDYEMEPESDDDFDETTLWENASMLKTTDLPSKDSLLPPMPSSRNIIDDYDDYQTSSENEDYEEFNNEYYGEYDNEARHSIVIFSQEDALNLNDEVVSDMEEPLATWEDALNEAIIAGLPRSKATAADWETAMTEAITLRSLSFEHPQASLDSLESVATVVIAKDAVGPYSAVYNPAILHPVFFTEALVSDVHNIHPAAIGHTKLLRFSASFNDWDRALGKVTSTRTIRVQRPTAFAFMWKDALKEAIAAGTPRKVETPNVTKLQQSTVKLTIDTSPSYGVTSLHPFFFATTLISNTADIHPACIGHCFVTSSHPMSESRLWSQKSTSKTSVIISGLWTKPPAPTQEIKAQFEELVSDAPRKVIVQQILELPTLESHELWQPSPISLSSTNWLRASSKLVARGNFLFQKPITTVITPSYGLMWKPSPSIKCMSDMFANVKHKHVPRPSAARSSLLPRLESSELYTVSEKSESEINWLHRSFAAPIITAQDMSKMWTANGSSTPDLFSTIMHEPLKRVFGTRPSVLPRLEYSELFTFKNKMKAEIDWLRLSAAPVSSTPRKSMMWTANGPSTPDLFSNIMHEPIKRISSARPSFLPQIKSSVLFTLEDKAKVEIDWLYMSIAPIIVTPRKSLMWAASSKPTTSTPDLFTNVKVDSLKRLSAVRPSILPLLSSTELFKVKSHKKVQINWLRASVAKSTNNEPVAQAMIVEAPVVGNSTFDELVADVETLTNEEIAELLTADEFTKGEEVTEKLTTDELPIKSLWRTFPNVAMEGTVGTWKPSPPIVIARPDIFIKNNESYSQKSSTSSHADLQRLESSNLFMPSSNSKTKIDWLHASSVSSAPNSTLTPRTWVLKSLSLAQVSAGGMWMPSTTKTVIELHVFSDPWTQPLIRKSRQELEKNIESTELWTVGGSTRESTKHWLLG